MKIDKKIIIKLKSRDEHAFEAVYSKYGNLIYHVIYQIVENKDDTDDLTQDTLVQMMKSIETFNENNNFKYWLLQIAKNKAYDFVRKYKRVINVNNFIDSIADPNEYDFEETDFKEMMKQYKDIITKDEFDIITLHLFHNLKFREIAKIYDRTVSSVNNLYHRGIKKIKKHWD